MFPLSLETLLLFTAVTVSAFVVVRPVATGARAAGLVLGAVLLTASLASFWLARAEHASASAAQLEGALPGPDPARPEYVTSNACAACHPAEYASWHATYHRTMTQPATPAAVLGHFDDRVVSVPEFDVFLRLARRGDEFWVDVLAASGGPGETSALETVTRNRVIMTTGSHHHQTYWLASGDDTELGTLPLVWLIDEQRWVPRDAVALRDPEAPPSQSRWNDNCIECHSTPGGVFADYVPGVSKTFVGELGISCEACHGPGRDHAAANRQPGRRYAEHLDGEHDPTIAQPKRLSASASSQVCGQCHGFHLTRTLLWLDGQRYRPGDDLSVTRISVSGSSEIAGRADPADAELQQAFLEHRAEPRYLENRFWRDGMVRVSGREYTAMIESACFREGELSCLSCHSMHDYASTDDQLRRDRNGDDACIVCHSGAAFEASLEGHTRHAPDSAGSSCVDCHMPRTTYGLRKAIRSHWIDSPSVRNEVETGRPNACNLCHLDRSLGWTAANLSAWYGQPAVSLGEDEAKFAAGVLWLTRGDAGGRALAADAMGRAAAVEASGRDWMAPHLARALDDRYPVVRHIAFRALALHPAFDGFPFDFTAEPWQLARSRAGAERRWEERRPVELDVSGERVLVDDRGALDVSAWERLRAGRVDPPMDLRE